MIVKAKFAHRRKARLVRARIRHAAFTRAPLRLTGGLLGMARSITHFAIAQRAIELPHLPAALEGLRIAHLSDLHIGELIGPRRLGPVIDATSAMQADMVAVTGDFVDLNLDVLDEVIRQLRRLRAPLGVFLVAGNHDHLVDGPRLIGRFREAGLDLLTNEHRQAVYRGSQVTIGGIDFAHQDGRLSRFVARSFRGLPVQGPRGSLRLLLAHHPHAFDAAHQHGVDLTLSGHTHGGQLVLSAGRSRKGCIGLGSLAFRYPKGLYRCGHRYLHVSCGIGSWFPLRVQCPPEITCLTLRRPQGASTLGAVRAG